MKYIFLNAGKGSRLHPLTLDYPKSLYRLDKDTSILQRFVSLIKKHDKDAEIVIVVGFESGKIINEIADVKYVNNPFYEVTNSIASLWFAKDYLDKDEVVIINGDVVVEERMVEEIICKKTDKPRVCIDSSIRSNGDYNVQVNRDRILAMSKNLETYYGEYVGITKLDANSAQKLKASVEQMVNSGMYDQWYENALVKMIFNEDFCLYYDDVRDYKWTEVDSVEDLLLAKQIHFESYNDSNI
ncbi:MAG: NTP transferase domain-containing protein [Clostridiales bacterium]|nr:NTP transferase domain-containing protein [Clostridiales bacterium]